MLFNISNQQACPECQAPLVIRSSKQGPFSGCSRYPECHYIRPLRGQSENPIVKVLEGVHCPQCGLDKVLKQGKFGMYIGCLAYPECDYTESIEKPDDTELACPVCRQGKVMQRRSRYGKTFFSCSTYPTCQFLINFRPVAGQCSQCGFSLLIEKKTAQGSKRLCANKACACPISIDTKE